MLQPLSLICGCVHDPSVSHVGHLLRGLVISSHGDELEIGFALSQKKNAAQSIKSEISCQNVQNLLKTSSKSLMSKFVPEKL